ncbi:hypothetical protein [Humibacter sp.]|uniref:hypothetical protein n=1 Tax=Humibacter sp. TaxID=1940291 RepID=UPI003F80B4C3
MTTTEPLCPKCQGPMWDNRETKKNPKAPDYKCRDKACDGVIWPPKGNAAPRAAAPAPVKAAYSSGPHIPAIDDEHPALPHEKLDTIFATYHICFRQAHKEASEVFGKDVADGTVAAMSATLLIAAQKAGVC